MYMLGMNATARSFIASITYPSCGAEVCLSPESPTVPALSKLNLVSQSPSTSSTQTTTGRQATKMNGTTEHRSDRLKILIVGAGIGGLTAGLALRQHGHEVLVNQIAREP